MDQVKIGRFIAAMRSEAELTQAALAEILGVSNRTVSKWECGGGLPEVSLWRPLCGALHITADELLQGERASADAEAEPERPADPETDTGRLAICALCGRVFRADAVHMLLDREYGSTYNNARETAGTFCYSCAKEWMERGLYEEIEECSTCRQCGSGFSIEDVRLVFNHNFRTRFDYDKDGFSGLCLPCAEAIVCSADRDSLASEKM